MLRIDLQFGRRRINAMVFIMLQLASLEECWGDWLALRNHWRAAFETVNSLYTHEMVMESEVSRRLFNWCVRLDMATSSIYQRPPLLLKVWLESQKRWYEDQTTQNPSEPSILCRSLISNLQLISFEIASLFAEVSAGKISVDDFATRNAALDKRLLDGRTCLDSVFGSDVVDSEVAAVSHRPQQTSPSTVIRVLFDWYSVKVLQLARECILLDQPLPVDLSDERRVIVNSLICTTGTPLGSIVPKAAALGMSYLLLAGGQQGALLCAQAYQRIEIMG